MHPAFEVHVLNEQGIHTAKSIALEFDSLLEQLEMLCDRQSREMSIVRTKLEEACFFAKKSMANMPSMQK